MSTGGRELVLRDGWEEWYAETEPLLTFIHIDYAAKVLPGAPDREGEPGATLYWTDGVTGQWAEHYKDAPTAVARLAALMRCAESGEFFRDGPDGFVRWSDNFFRQTVCTTPQPTIPGGVE